MLSKLDPRRSGAIVIRLATTLSILAGHAAPALAQTAGVARFAIQQPAQDLADALRAIARQTGTSVLFDPETVKGRIARPVSGQYSAAEALQRALEGSGLVVEATGDRAAIVRLPAPRAVPVAAPASVSLAPAAQETGSNGEALPPGAPAVAQMQRVEVTGSRLRRIGGEGPMPVNVYQREDILRSGQPTLERFISGLNEASVSGGEGTYGVGVGQGTVQLRGLPVGSTLVLINGRRVQAVGSSSANFFNLNLIPLAAVERVEVVPVGSSAVYGGDALAGVVNVILKKSLDGLSFDARIGGGRGFDDSSLSLAGGWRGEEGSLLVVGSLNRASTLSMAERPSFFENGDYRPLGGDDNRVELCTPGNVRSADGRNLPGLNSPRAAIPALPADRRPVVSDFVATAGETRLCNELMRGHGFSLVHGGQNAALHVAGERHLGARWSLFMEATYADDRLRATEAGRGLNNVLVPATNPYNPFGVPVRVSATMGMESPLGGLARDTRLMRLVGGIRGELGRGWDLEAAVSTSRDKGEQRLGNLNVNSTALAAALASNDPATALNPFTTGRVATEAVTGSIWSDQVRLTEGKRDQVGSFVRGPLGKLPAGTVDVIAGVDAWRDYYDSRLPGGRVSHGERDFQAVFGEGRLPLARRSDAAGRGGELAAVTVAARRDRYSDFGSAATYQAGLELRPAASVMLRGSLASSFKPPTVLQLNVADASTPPTTYGLVDPLRDRERITTGEVARGTNLDLRAEKGRAFALGGAWEPAVGTRVGVTAWRLKIDGLIGLLPPQAAVDNEALFPGFVTREPTVNGVPGRVIRVRHSEVNFGRVESAGIDLEASHSVRIGVGTWTLGASATRATRYEVLLAPGAAVQDRLGRRYLDYWAPEWKGRLSVGLENRAWSLGLVARYLGTYKDAGKSERRMGDFFLYDLSGRIDLKRLGVPVGAARTASLSIGVVNLSNRMPEFAETYPYFDATQADWRGRTLSARLSVDW